MFGPVYTLIKPVSITFLPAFDLWLLLRRSFKTYANSESLDIMSPNYWIGQEIPSIFK